MVLTKLGLPPVLAVLMAMGLSALLGIAIERLTMRPLIGEPLLAVVMMTIAVSMILRGLSLITFTPEIKACPSIFPEDYISIGNVSFAPYLLIGLVFSILTLAAFTLFFTYTKIGLKMRCVSDNHSGPGASASRCPGS